ncbi:hypothetical protein SI65_01365 [Aspergillus cristatus]|uniref:Uncharacterized protein n=1 Tax=Aspergillus cristatus TaxID=573508 RepID=A0A1E3BTU9_ASPCR|nr:hypothetical protein SI65_01365 [Aspergillus cristatus]
MAFESLSIKRPHSSSGAVSAIVTHNFLRDTFTIQTWLLIGAALQSLLTIFLPLPYAILPAICLLSWRAMHTVLMALGYIRNTNMNGVVWGKFSAQVPGRDGMLPEKGAAEDVTVIMLGARSNHPLGIFGPGYQQVGDFMNKMLAQLEGNAEEYGFLGSTTYLEATARQTSNQSITVCYFRSIEEMHRYAHSPLHREAWNWWNSITRTHPHLSISHEVYHAPKGCWENIYVNYHLTGIANMRIDVKSSEGGVRPIVDASRGGLRTQTGRLAKSDGADNDKYGIDPY